MRLCVGEGGDSASRGVGGSGSSSSGSPVYVVVSTTRWRRDERGSGELRAEGVYTNQDMAYSHAVRRLIEDGAACLDDEGLQGLARVAADMSAMSMPLKDCWNCIHEYLERVRGRLDWDVWPSCWVEESQLSVRRDAAAPSRILEGLEYLFSEEVAGEEEA